MSTGRAQRAEEKNEFIFLYIYIYIYIYIYKYIYDYPQELTNSSTITFVERTQSDSSDVLKHFAQTVTNFLLALAEITKMSHF